MSWANEWLCECFFGTPHWDPNYYDSILLRSESPVLSSRPTKEVPYQCLLKEYIKILQLNPYLLFYGDWVFSLLSTKEWGVDLLPAL